MAAAFELPVKVRWRDVDALGHVNHAVFLTYLEEGRDAFFIQALGGDPAALYDSLTHKLAKVPDHALLFPGHLYSAEPSASMEDTRRWNYVFTPKTQEQWLAMFG